MLNNVRLHSNIANIAKFNLLYNYFNLIGFRTFYGSQKNNWKADILFHRLMVGNAMSNAFFMRILQTLQKEFFKMLGINFLQSCVGSKSFR